jgi:5-methylcytosine-specific restriction enzyme subunit McrC
MIATPNLYHMLAYAFRPLAEDGYSSLQTEDFDHVHDLFAAILVRGIAMQVKRGLNRDYRIETESEGYVRGKIDMSETIKRRTAQTKRLVCQYDLFCEDTTLNRILKTTALLLLRHGDVREERRSALKKLMVYFEGVETLDTRRIVWNGLAFHRHNATYRMLMSVCQLVLTGLLVSNQEGQARLTKYLTDLAMHRLYELFVLNYFRVEYPRFDTSASCVDWDTDEAGRKALPMMQTDITLKYMQKVLIIDTKYYGHVFQTNSQFGSTSLISGNLYQIFTYVKNYDRQNSGRVGGLLLYAMTDDPLSPDLDCRIGGNRFSIRTLDLSADWATVTQQLGEVASMLEYA